MVDTHTALWYLLGNPRLSDKARQFIDDAAASGYDILLSPISLAEIVYPIEKKRLPQAAYNDLKTALADDAHVIEEAPFNGEIVEAMIKV